MKTKAFFIFCLIMGMATTLLFSQNNTVQYKVRDAEYHTYVYCDGVLVDFLSGAARLHVVYHLKDGIWQWEIDQYKGEAVSVGIKDENGNLIGGTGEVFYTTAVLYISRPIKNFPMYMWHERLIGNKGHVYSGFVYFNWDTGELYPGKTECN
jgi:hypothetical protein